MPVKFGSILQLNNATKEATLDANNLRGTTIQIDDFTSSSLATIGSGLVTAPGKRRLGTIVSTTGSADKLPEYYVYHQTSSGDLNLSGSEWVTASNWREIALQSNSVNFHNITSSGIISASIISASNVLITGSLVTDGTLSFSGFNFSEESTQTISGSTQFGSASGTNIANTTHQFTGSIFLTGSGIFPDVSGTIDLGSATQKFTNLFATNTFFGGVHEINLETEGLDQMQEGTILSLKNGTLHPCEKEADSLVMGVVSFNSNFPIILGAEPILITGKIKEGDYIITSNVKGHGIGIDPKYIYHKQLFGKIIAQAIESGNGKSYTIKAMIRKM